MAINASTGALLGAILLVGMGGELWLPLMPQYLNLLQANLLLIGLYGTGKDALDAAAFYFGGALAARFNTRRALLIFNALPLVGLGLLLAWPSRASVFVALPFIAVWNSSSGPAMLRVVGESLGPGRRSMAFALQSIQKRLSSILAYLVSGQLILWLGQMQGIRAGIALAAALVALSLAMQYRYMNTAVSDRSFAMLSPRRLFRRFDPRLRRLLLSDLLARWCEGLVREFVIFYCLGVLLASGFESPGAATAFYVAVLLSTMNLTSLAIYLPIGHYSSRPGAKKKAWIGLTFLFFALFPVALATLGTAWGPAGLVAAFVIGGLREVGEPARKALITELVHDSSKTQAIGLYWALRSLAIMPAPIVGGLSWLVLGPEPTLWLSGLVGVVGMMAFAWRFPSTDPEAPASGDEARRGP